MCSRLVRVKKKKKSLSLNETLMFLKCLKRQTVLADALMRVWWESRHPLPQTNTTECSGNCWLTVPIRNHAAARNHHLPTRRCLLHQLTLIVTPTHADSAVIISKLQYSSCSSLLFKKKQTDTTSLRRLSLSAPAMHLHVSTTAWDRGGRGPHQKAPRVLIDMHQLSSYRLLLLLLLLHWQWKKGRQAGTELLHRDIDEKPTALLYDPASPLSPKKTGQSSTLS